MWKVLLVTIFFFVLPTQVWAQEKTIKVDTRKQMLYALENGSVVWQTKVSTGLVQTPTIKGIFTVYRKVEVKDMAGFSRVKGKYYLKNVPLIMYFQGSYAIHGAYWHNNFGRRMSNGCINLPLGAAKWLFDWTPVGTKTIIV